jgi:uncharacterized Zn-finger protein
LKFIHQKLKPQSCPACKSRFSLKCDLKIHFETVHEKKQDHECHICGRKFGIKGNLKKHIKRIHDNVPNK